MTQRRTTDPTTAVAAARIADLLDAVESLFRAGGSRPRARRALATIAADAAAASTAIKNCDADVTWEQIRTAVIVQFMRERNNLPHVFDVALVVSPNDTPTTR